MKDNTVPPPILQKMLATLASELKEPKINSLELIMTDKDFDNRRRSLFDPEKKRIVTKIGEKQLADAPTTPLVRRNLEGQLREALRTHYEAKQKAS